MFKRMFQFSSSEGLAAPNGRHLTEELTPGVIQLKTALQCQSENSSPAATGAKAPPKVCENFEEVYEGAGIPEAGARYTILKVAGMLSSKYLSDLSPDAKRNSLMMALEAAEVEVGALLQDAVARNRALDEYEDKRQEQVKVFEGAKAEENNKLHAELERLTNQYMSRIQANSDLVAEEQDKFRAWQKKKQQEAQSITDAATVCVPQGNSVMGVSNLTAVLERVTVVRR